LSRGSSRFGRGKESMDGSSQGMAVENSLDRVHHRSGDMPLHVNVTDLILPRLLPGYPSSPATAHRYIRDLGPSSSAFAAGLFCATSERIAELAGSKMQEVVLCGTGEWWSMSQHRMHSCKVDLSCRSLPLRLRSGGTGSCTAYR
jgi:hypothetical protein